MGTLAGNFVNASPIGDLTALFIALGAEITLQAPDGTSRQLPLRKLYKGYKDLDRAPDEVLVRVRFKLPDARTRFNFEKVSKRTYLDIASVNSAIRLEMDGPIVREALLSAGGVAPVPRLLEATSAFLAGKEASAETLLNAVPVMNAEIAPISDARGTADYKRLLLRQLLFAHFMELFPDRFKLKELV
jgi:xanthine dehydrogenase small subunit